MARICSPFALREELIRFAFHQDSGRSIPSCTQQAHTVSQWALMDHAPAHAPGPSGNATHTSTYCDIFTRPLVNMDITLLVPTGLCPQRTQGGARSAKIVIACKIHAEVGQNGNMSLNHTLEYHTTVKFQGSEDAQCRCELQDSKTHRALPQPRNTNHSRPSKLVVRMRNFGRIPRGCVAHAALAWAAPKSC